MGNTKATVGSLSLVDRHKITCALSVFKHIETSVRWLIYLSNRKHFLMAF